MKAIVFLFLSLFSFSCKENIELNQIKNFSNNNKFNVKFLESNDSNKSNGLQIKKMSNFFFDQLKELNKSKLGNLYTKDNCSNKIILIKKRDEIIAGAALSTYGGVIYIDNFVPHLFRKINLELINQIKLQAISNKCTKIAIRTYRDIRTFQELSFELEGKIENVFANNPLYVLSIKKLDQVSKTSKENQTVKIIDEKEEKYNELEEILAQKSKKEDEKILGKYDKRIIFGYVEDSNKNSIGCIKLVTYENVAYVSLLVVNENFQKQGLGASLMKEAKNYLKLKSKKINIFFLTTQEFQNARGFYEKQGFITELIIPNNFFSLYQTIFMVKRL